MTESEALTSSEPIIFQEQEVQQQNELKNQLPNHIELVLREEKFIVDKYVLSSLPKNMIKLMFNNKLQGDKLTQKGDSENNSDTSSSGLKDIIKVDFDPSYFRYILNSIEQAGRLNQQKEIDDDDDDKREEREEKKLKVRYYSLKFLLYHMENKPDVYLYDTTIYNFMEKETFIILREELYYYMLPLNPQQQDKVKFIQSLKSKAGKSLVDETNILDPLLKKIKKDHIFANQQQDNDNDDSKIEKKETNNNDNGNKNGIEKKETNNNDDDIRDEIVKNEEKEIKQQPLQQRPFTDMLHDFGFNSTSQWAHRKLQPGKANILSISMVQLNLDGSLDERLEAGFKILHLRQKPAIKCWWEMDEIILDDIQIKFWKRREWTLQLFSI